MLTTLLTALSVSAVSYAQDLDALLEKVNRMAEDAFVTVAYTAELSGAEGNVEDRGMIEAQDGLWHLKGSHVEIYTDGEGTWIVDDSTKEVYVEPVWTFDDLRTFYDTILSSGSKLSVEILNESIEGKKPVSVFTPAFSSEWVVTDLR